MKKLKFSHFCSFLIGAAIMFAMGSLTRNDAQTRGHVYELRMYHITDGKMDAVKNRFRDHVLAAFARHNMKPIGFWIPQDDNAGKLIVYILEHPSRQEADANWAAFNADPAWVKAKAESEANGKILDKVDRYFMDPADFSPIR